MSSSYNVVTAALTGHAQDLTGLSDEATQARTTAKGVAVTADAYGRTAQGFAAMLNSIARAGHDTLLAAAKALDRAATELRGTATDYDHVDADGARRLRSAADEDGITA